MKSATRIVITFVVLALLVSACGVVGYKPKPTPTRVVPVDKVLSQISKVLFHAGDLGPDWVSESDADSLPAASPFDTFPASKLALTITLNNAVTGQKAYIVYANYRAQELIDQAYNALFTGTDVEGLGGSGKSMVSTDSILVAFKNCKNLIYIQVPGMSETDVINYAMTMSERITSTLCR
jgi:hypothetical protein